MSDLKPANLKVVELRSELSKRNLSTKGKKNELVSRLTEALESEKNNDSNNNEQVIEEPEEDKASLEHEQIIQEQSTIVYQTESIAQDASEASEQLVKKTTEAVIEATSEALIEKSSEQVIEKATEEIIKKPEEQLAQTSTENTADSFAEKATDAENQQTLEKPQEQLIEKPQEQLIEKPQEQLIEKPQEQLIEKPQEQLIEKPEEQLIEKPQEQLIEKPQEQLIEKPQEQLIEKPQEQLIEKPQEQLIEKPQEQLIEKPQEQLIEKPQEQLINKPQEQSVEQKAEPMETDSNYGLKRKRSESDTNEEEKRLKTVENKEETTESTALYIKGFVRPLIIKHVRELLAQYGTVKRFWMDSIKTHCYVTYETKLEAKEAFISVNGIKFPADTGRILSAGELTSEQADKLIEYEQNAAEKRLKVDWEVMINKIKSGEALDSSASSNDDSGSRRFRSIGIGQITKQLAQAAEPINAPVTKVIPEVTKAKEISLDDLFRKTKALPQLYYLPNSEQEAKLKLEKLQQNH